MTRFWILFIFFFFSFIYTHICIPYHVVYEFYLYIFVFYLIILNAGIIFFFFCYRWELQQFCCIYTYINIYKIKEISCFWILIEVIVVVFLFFFIILFFQKLWFSSCFKWYANIDGKWRFNGSSKSYHIIVSTTSFSFP